MGTGVNKYGSAEERDAAIAAGEASRRRSSLMDGRKHYAVVEYDNDGDSRIEKNLTGTNQDDLRTAEHLAENRDHGPFGPGVAGYGAERIA